MTGIIYGSSMGNTEEAANLIAANLGIDEVLNIADTDAATINGFDKLIIGSSTWGSGDLQDDWDSFDFDKLEVSGKTIALLVWEIAQAIQIHTVMLWEYYTKNYLKRRKYSRCYIYRWL